MKSRPPHTVAIRSRSSCGGSKRFLTGGLIGAISTDPTAVATSSSTNRRPQISWRLRWGRSARYPRVGALIPTLQVARGDEHDSRDVSPPPERKPTFAARRGRRPNRLITPGPLDQRGLEVDAISTDLPIQGGAPDPRKLGGSGAVTLRLGQRIHDRRALDLLHTG